MEICFFHTIHIMMFSTIFISTEVAEVIWSFARFDFEYRHVVTERMINSEEKKVYFLFRLPVIINVPSI